MSILSGYKRFKKYLRTADGYRLCSEWTKSDSVEMADGKTLQETVSDIGEAVENVQGEVKSVQDDLHTSLGGITFGVDAAGRYGYIKAGADTVTPFRNPEDLSGYKLVDLSAGATFGNEPVTQRGSTYFHINDYNKNPKSPLYGMKKFIAIKRLWGISTGYGGLSGANILNNGLTLEIGFQKSSTASSSWSTNISVYCLPEQ